MNEQTLQELTAYVAIQSISTDEDKLDQITLAQQFLQTKLQALGFETKLITTSGNAAVFAHKKTESTKPTILIYGHYDVQPADKEDGWLTEPFTLTQKQVNGKENLYGRGITDNKAPLWVSIKAIEQAIAENIPLPNIKFIIEGEEELGSKHFQEIVDNHTEDLRAEYIFVSDSLNVTKDEFTLLYGMRGLIYFHARINGPPQDEHSGIYGGLIGNPHQELCRILSACKDAKTGEILIPGIYEDVKEPTEIEIENLKKIPLVLPNAPLYTQDKVQALINKWMRPTFDIHGISGGYTQKGKKTIIPSYAEAKVSVRLVPNMDPYKTTKQLKKFLEELNPNIKLTIDAASPALEVDINHDVIKKTKQIIEDITQHTTFLTKSGGTIPAIAMLNEKLNVPIIDLGLGLPDDGMHAPNEKFNVERFDLGVKLFKNIFSKAFE